MSEQQRKIIPPATTTKAARAPRQYREPAPMGPIAYLFVGASAMGGAAVMFWLFQETAGADEALSAMFLVFAVIGALLGNAMFWIGVVAQGVRVGRR